MVTGSVALGAAPVNAVATPDGSRLYVTVQPGGVAVVDTQTDRLIRTVHVGEEPAGIAVSRDSARVYVTDRLFEGFLHVIDTRTDTVEGGPVAVGELPLGVAVSPDGRRAFVVNHEGGTVSVVDTAAGAVTATVRAARSPGGHCCPGTPGACTWGVRTGRSR